MRNWKTCRRVAPCHFFPPCMAAARITPAFGYRQRRHCATKRGELKACAHHRSLLALSFILVSVVLKPDLHLCWCEVDQVRQVLSFRGRQVTLFEESFLEFVSLRFREEHPAPAFPRSRAACDFRLVFALLRGGVVVVVFFFF